MNRKSLGCLLELAETLLVTAVIFLLLQMFVVQPYQVQQTSMENTLMPDQYVLVDKLSPNFDAYHRGDIVVFNPPQGWAKDANGTPFVKRVIGIAGDKIDIEAGKVYLNGEILDEPYVFEQQATDLPGTDTKKSWTVEAGPPVRDGRPPPGLAGFARLRLDRQVDRDRPCLAPILADREFRPDQQQAHPNPERLSLRGSLKDAMTRTRDLAAPSGGVVAEHGGNGAAEQGATPAGMTREGE